MRHLFLACCGALLCQAVVTAQTLSVKYLEANKDTGSSKAVVVENVPLAHTSQMLPVDADGKLVGKGQAVAQIDAVLDNLAHALAASEAGWDGVVKINVYVTKAEIVGEVHKVFARRFATEPKPSVSFVVTALPIADALVAMDAVAVSKAKGATVALMRTAKLQRATAAHAAVLPPGARLYISGQAEKGSDLKDATRKTLDSLLATLKHLERTGQDVVQVKAFMKPMSEAKIVEAEIARFFGERSAPPIVLVEWQSTLPIEIELIASAGVDRKGDVVEYLTPPGVQASPVFTRVARINRGPSIYVAGLYGGAAKTAASEVTETFDELKRIVGKAGGDLRHLAKATYYVSDEDVSKKLNELRPMYYDAKRPPAASKAMVAGVGVEGKRLTLDMIAVPTGK